MTDLDLGPRYRDMAFGASSRTRARFVRWEWMGPKKVAIRICKETGVEFTDKNGQMDFANSIARGIHLQRRIKRGLAIVDLALRWRGDRKDKAAVGDLCNVISMFLDEDKKAGRPSW